MALWIRRPPSCCWTALPSRSTIACHTLLYKNINPKDYAKLQYGKGNLVNIFNNLRTNVKNKINILKDEIKTKECDIEAVKNTTIKSFEQLKWIVKAVIFENRNYSYEGNPLEIESLTTFERCKLYQI